MLRRKKHAAAAAAAAPKATPKAMTPSAAYPYYEEKPMVFRGVKVAASPRVSMPSGGGVHEGRGGRQREIFQG